MNALLGKNRAIVTDQPGTTRDYLEESLNLDGLTVRIADTAGLRSTDDAIEAAGLEMGRELMDQADLILFLVDNSAPLSPETETALHAISPDKTLIALNKVDLAPADPAPADLLAQAGFETVRISAKFGTDLDALCARIRERILAGEGQPDPDEIAPNARQARVLKAAHDELELLALDSRQGIPYDLLGVRLETACDLLSSITGEIASADILNAIFDTFCIGK